MAPTEFDELVAIREVAVVARGRRDDPDRAAEESVRS
jgi:hypothetical protein